MAGSTTGALLRNMGSPAAEAMLIALLLGQYSLLCDTVVGSVIGALWLTLL